jgi:hypothetical protein
MLSSIFSYLRPNASQISAPQSGHEGHAAELHANVVICADADEWALVEPRPKLSYADALKRNLEASEWSFVPLSRPLPSEYDASLVERARNLGGAGADVEIAGMSHPCLCSGEL